MVRLLPKVIDLHAHVGDLIYGQPLDEPYLWPVWTAGRIMEWSGYRASKPPWGFRRFARYLEVIHNQQRNNCATVHNVRRYSQPYGITHSVLQPIEPVLSTEYTLEVSRSASTPDHCFVSFASVDPRAEDRLARLERYMAAGCLGLKLHPIVQNLPATDERYFELAEAMKKYKKPILIHSGRSDYYIPAFKRREYGHAGNYEKLIGAFPDVPFILAHMNMAEPEVVWELARKHENVFADASFQSAHNIRQAFNKMGTDRVLFASDCPFSLPKYALQVGKKAVGDNQDLAEKFFFRNVEALIGELELPESWKAVAHKLKA